MADGYTDRFDFSEALVGKPKSVERSPALEPISQPITEETGPVQRSDAAGQDTTGRIKKKAPGKKGQASQKADDKTSYLSIPKSLVSAVRSVLPADTVSDAVSAYLYITMGRTVAVPDRIKEIADGFEDDAGISDLQREVIALRQQLRTVTEQLSGAVQLASESQMALTWLIGEKLGYGVNMTAAPEKMDFLFPEYDSLLRRVKQQWLEHANQLKLREGRDIYKARFGKETP